MRFIKRIIRKIAAQVFEDIKRKESESARMVFNSIKIKGNNSKFLGKNIYVSDVNKIEIGTNVTIDENAYIKSEGGVIIGDNTHISRNLVLYTVNHNYDADVLPYNNELIERQVVIGHNVWIGMNVCITPGTVIGDGCIIEMGTVVSGNVPPLSIIGSEKWRIIGNRDANKYAEILQKKRFGKENGLLYRSGDKIIKEIGDFYTNQRTHIEIINFEGKTAVKKSWVNNPDSLKAFNNEKEMYSIFKGYPWLPALYESGENYLIIEYIDNNYRIDQLNISNKSSYEKNKILGDILGCLLDMFAQDIAHCDIHSKNIFVTPQGIKIIDFETAQRLDENTPFFESYDIVAKGLLSPYNTNRSCVLGEGKFALKAVFQLEDVYDLKQRFQDYLIEELHDVSNTFFTRKNSVDGRHTLRNSNIYSTFDLQFLKVDRSKAQRDIKRRFSKLNVDKNLIRGKNVLDIGSNIGSVLFEVVKMKPKSMLGLEYDQNKVKISNTIRSLHFKNENLEFKVCDVEKSSFFNNLPSFEIVFCLAVVDHLKNKDSFFKKLGELCTDTLYFEGNSGTDISYIKEKLKGVGFDLVEYLGFSDDEKDIRNNVRPLFRAQKNGS